MLFHLPLSLLVLLVLSFNAYVVHTIPDTGSGSNILQCNLNLDTNKITCGSVTCTVLEIEGSSTDLLPRGFYRIGEAKKDTNKYPLYPHSGDFYWDSKLGVPGLCCVMSLAIDLHEFSYSKLGSIALSSQTCKQELAEILNEGVPCSFNARKCDECPMFFGCWWNKCRCGEQTIEKNYIALLLVHG